MHFRNLKEDLEELLESQYDKELYLPAQSTKTQEYIRNTYVTSKQGNFLSLFCQLDIFKSMGLGVYLFFRFLKEIIYLFALMSVSSGALMLLFYTHSGLKYEGSSIGQILSLVSLGNLDNSVNKNQQYMIVALDVLNSFFYLCFVIYWNEVQNKIIIECAETHALPSYYTVILKEIPRGYTEQKIVEHFEKESKRVEQIYTVKNYQNILLYYKDLNQIINQLKLENALNCMYPDRDKSKNIRLLEQFETVYFKIKTIECKQEKVEPVMAFISFETISIREHLLKQTHHNCCAHTQIQPFQGQKLQIQKCEFEPSSIIWENIHLDQKNKIFRFIIPIFCISIVMAIGIFVIFTVSLVSQNSNSTQDVFQCTHLNIYQFYENYNSCNSYTKEYLMEIGISLLFPLLLLLLKYMLTKTVNSLSHYHRYGNIVQLIRNQMVNYLVVSFVSSALIALFIHLQIGSLSFNQLIFPMVKLLPSSQALSKSTLMYHDFVKDWYIQVSKQIVIAGIISFWPGFIVDIVIAAIGYMLKALWICTAQIQKQANEIYRGDKINFSNIYAQVICVVWLVCFYSAGLPILVLIATVALSIIYLSTKYYFLNYCERPPLLNNSINHFIIKLMVLGLAIHCVMSPIFYGASLELNLGHSLSILERYILYYEYSIVLLITVIYWFFREIIVHFCVVAYQRITNRYHQLPTQIRNIKQTYRNVVEQNHHIRFSYDMQQNEQFMPIIYTLRIINKIEANRKTYLSNKLENIRKSTENSRRLETTNKVDNYDVESCLSAKGMVVEVVSK